MLNREEYNMTFNRDLSQEEFDKITGLVLDQKNIKEIEQLSFVDAETHEVFSFYNVVKCCECKYFSTEYEWHGDYGCRLYHEPKGPDWFCADGTKIRRS